MLRSILILTLALSLAAINASGLSVKPDSCDDNDFETACCPIDGFRESALGVEDVQDCRARHIPNPLLEVGLP